MTDATHPRPEPSEEASAFASPLTEPAKGSHTPASDVVLGPLLIALAVLVARYLGQIPSEAAMILRVAALGLGLGGVGVLISGVRGLRTGPRASRTVTAEADEDSSLVSRILAFRILVVPLSEILMVAATVAFILLVPRVGFFVASGLFIAVMLAVYRERRWVWIVPVSVLVIYALDWLFFGFLNLRSL